jgi:hypothetical protein
LYRVQRASLCMLISTSNCSPLGRPFNNTEICGYATHHYYRWRDSWYSGRTTFDSSWLQSYYCGFGGVTHLKIHRGGLFQDCLYLPPSRGVCRAMWERSSRVEYAIAVQRELFTYWDHLVGYRGELQKVSVSVLYLQRL